MPTTTTRRSSRRSPLVIAILLLGLAGLWIGPMGCGGETEEASTQEATSQNTSDRSILLNVGFNDETSDRPPHEEFLIETPDGDRWQPSYVEGGFTAEAFGKYPVGETQRLLLYPEGEGGSRLEVPFTMKPDMSSILASSRTEITVYDDSMIVAGPSVPDERMAFDRPSSPSEAP